VTLVCPSCARSHDDDQRFCADCGLPLVPEGGPAEAVVDERRARARKIKPQYAEGDLVPVAHGRHQPEAEFLQGLLLEEGVPSTLRRSRGFDVPEMLFAGPRDVLVPTSGVAAAREVLLQADAADRPPSAGVVPPAQVLIGLLVAVGVVALIVFALDALG
jgi:hypothetical protein